MELSHPIFLALPRSALTSYATASESTGQPLNKVVNRIPQPHAQHKRIAHAGQPKGRFHVSAPVARQGIAQDRTHILLLARPVEAELMCVAYCPHHLQPIAQTLERKR